MHDALDFSGWPTFPCSVDCKLPGEWVELTFQTDVMTYEEFPRWLLELFENHNIKSSGDPVDMLDRMTRRQREVVELRATGKTQEEIGAELGIKKPAVSRILSRASGNVNF